MRRAFQQAPKKDRLAAYYCEGPQPITNHLSLITWEQGVSTAAAPEWVAVKAEAAPALYEEVEWGVAADSAVFLE